MRSEILPGMRRRIIIDDQSPVIHFGYLLIWALTVPAATLFFLWLLAGNGLSGF